ncbi:MAG TPA: bifunctional 2-polyprenyl-6-hydroxyphenol methylase/3-demethylubiquinol 3-O-methyltransferase UbiG [Candidatus Limnocylindrales bacterium]|nr:bifunctional 2-polyprenyl-6-hydroxyphenol methylase/3-demethylubiquinol 3-O-methyltransferase UbiG [Candidatus Limnocylindrales bacterium]
MERDLELFNSLKDEWWNPEGPMGGLHRMNPARSTYFLHVLKRHSCRKVLELGCGGGILSSALEVEGIELYALDRLPSALQAARPHLTKTCLVCSKAENLPFPSGVFDAIVSSDFLEHVEDLDRVIAESSRVLKPEGLFLYDTINKTLKSLLVLKFIGEYLCGFIPKGTHQFKKLVPLPRLIKLMAAQGIQNMETHGLVPNMSLWRGLFRRDDVQFKLSREDLSMLYIGYGVKT